MNAHFFFFLLCLSFVFAKECAVGGGSCTKHGSAYCCSYWGYCGTTNDYCGTGTLQCVCDCKGTKPCASSTVAPSCTKYKVTASLNNRTGPGTNYAIKKTLAINTIVCVVSISNGWAKLDDGSYVSSSYITINTTTSTSTTTTTTTTNTSTGWTGTKRTGPAVSANFAGTCRGPTTVSGYQQDFISKMVLPAQRQEWKNRILASVTIAQGILESGWGKSPICNNLFGVKSYSSTEPRCLSPTKEVINGKTIDTACYFKKYNNWDESVADHSRVLLNGRYNAALGQRDYQTACKAIQAGGYATATNYANELIKVIESYGLWQYDLCCNYETSPSCVPKTTVTYVYKDPNGRCGIGKGSCKYITNGCCSYWGYCGTATGNCGTGKTECLCDCPGNKTPCCTSNSLTKC